VRVQIGQLTQLSAPSRLQFIAERYYNTPRRNMDRAFLFFPAWYSERARGGMQKPSYKPWDTVCPYHFTCAETHFSQS
jgi:hypothetical protein